jgi:hypothetical protein
MCKYGASKEHCGSSEEKSRSDLEGQREGFLTFSRWYSTGNKDIKVRNNIVHLGIY